MLLVGGMSRGHRVLSSFHLPLKRAAVGRCCVVVSKSCLRGVHSISRTNALTLDLSRHCLWLLYSKDCRYLHRSRLPRAPAVSKSVSIVYKIVALQSSRLKLA